MMDNYFTSRMLCLSGGLVSICGLMMALLGRTEYSILNLRHI